MKDTVTRIITHDVGDDIVLRATVSMRPDITGWQYCIEVRDGLYAILRKEGTMIDVVKSFAHWQCDNDRALVGINDEESDQYITDPWTDRTGRFPLSNKGACETYGTDNVLSFVSYAIAYLFDVK